MRYLVAIVGILAVVGALAAVKGAQIGQLMAFGKKMQAEGPPPETVSTAVAQKQTWESTISAVGSVTSAKGVALGNEAAGTVVRISFDSGQIVKQGQVLVELDTSVERAQLASLIARRDLAQTNAERTRTLVASGSIGKAQADNDDAMLKTATTDADALSAQIARKTVRAPFTGKVGIRQVNLGQYLNPGTPVTVLEATDVVFVDFTLPQQRLGDVTLGMPVRIQPETKSEVVDGTVSAIDSQLDAATRSIKIRASVPNKGDTLRPGMFANVSLVLPKQNAAVTVPATAIIHNSYGDSVFVVKDGKAQQQFVKVDRTRGDFVALSDGLAEGDTVVSAGAFKLRNGAKVVVDDKVKLDPKLDPKPENR